MGIEMMQRRRMNTQMDKLAGLPNPIYVIKRKDWFTFFDDAVMEVGRVGLNAPCWMDHQILDGFTCDTSPSKVI
jgi:hypothetical protein